MTEQEINHLTQDVERLQGELEDTRTVVYSLIAYLSPDDIWEQQVTPISTEEADGLIKKLYGN